MVRLSKETMLWYIGNMKRPETFFWYDIETFGLNPRHDRIAQFAGVRTDTNLSVIEEPTILYCTLSDDYLPDPLSCMVTGISPQEVMEKGIVESEFIGKINEILSVPGTCAVGYNTLRFDDEFLRNVLFRNFLDPYRREYDKGNSRWDLLDLARAAHDLRPRGINWPKKSSSGLPSFKLTDLTEANGIAHESAHDAMSDVWATLELARLIKWRQPKLFAYYLDLRDKNKVRQLLEVPTGAPVVYTAAPFTRIEGCTTVVLPITASSQNSNSIIVFDLMQDPLPLIAASEAFGELQASREREDALRAMVAEITTVLTQEGDREKTLERARLLLEETADLMADLPRLFTANDKLLGINGVHKVAINRVPFLSPLSVLEEDVASRLGIDVARCERHRELLMEHDMLAVNLRKAADADEYPVIDDVDFSLYSGPFFNNADAYVFSQIRQGDPETLWKTRFEFDDSRGHEMLWRYLCRNWPHAMDERQTQRWQSFCAQRLIQPPDKNATTLSFFARKITEHMNSKDISPKQKEVLAKLGEYGRQLCERVGLTYPE